MSGLYDKLGDMLNEVLESGKIPDKDKFFFNKENQNSELHEKACANDTNASHGNNERSSDSFSFNKTDSINDKEKINFNKFTNFEQKTSDTIIRNYNYNNELQFPEEIKASMIALSINYPFTQVELRKQYHKLLKTFHPDTVISENKKKPASTIDADFLLKNYNLLQSYFFIQKKS